MNYIEPNLKIHFMSYWLLGKVLFRTMKSQGLPHPTLVAFCDSCPNICEAFRMRYSSECASLDKIAGKIPGKGKGEMRYIYRWFDGEMATFGRWLVTKCEGAGFFESMRQDIEFAITAVYNSRNIRNTDAIAWKHLRSDCLKSLTAK